MFEQVIKHYPDFPKPGIDFIDVIPFLHDKKVFAEAIAELDRLCTAPNLATVEARGFLFASPLLSVSQHVQTLIPIRKQGKLPFAEGDLVCVEIEKEYGHDEVYFRRSDLAACQPTGDVIELTLFDDLLATGGTALGIAQALNREVINGRRVVVKEMVFLVELPALKGRGLLEAVAPVRSLMSLEGVE
ncbi:MAG: hypothetical protein IJU19_01415 [Bacteroidales bacterium]|nr:hypothetical protein [Bacteroidales bacterium]